MVERLVWDQEAVGSNPITPILLRSHFARSFVESHSSFKNNLKLFKIPHEIYTEKFITKGEIDMLKATTLVTGKTLNHFRQNNLKIGILHSGGPAPGGNLVLYAAAIRAKNHGVPMVAFKSGFRGPMTESVETIKNEWLMPMDREVRRYLRYQPALVPGTSRADPAERVTGLVDIADPIKTASMERILDVFEVLRLGAVIVVGGDNTMSTEYRTQLVYNRLLQQNPDRFKNFKGFVHVPKTIDKDYFGILVTFGFMSAAETIGGVSLRRYSDAKGTAEKALPVYFLVQVMGREAGWLTAATSIFGQAAYTFLPEDFSGRDKIPIDELVDDCVDVIMTRRNEDKHHGLIAFCEGVIGKIDLDTVVERDGQGNDRYEKLDIGAIVEGRIAEEFARRTGGGKIKLVPRKGGYGGRQVIPGIFDDLLCKKLGVAATDAVLGGDFWNMVTVEGFFDSNIIPFSDLVDPETLLVRNWHMSPDEGLYKLLRDMQQPFGRDVGK